jgi:hypothetical protein
VRIRTLFGALLGLLAGLALLRVIAGGTLLDAGGVEEAGDAIGRLRTDRQPMLGAIGVEHDALGVVLGEQRVVGADLLDEGAIARASASWRRRCGNKDASWRRRATGGWKRTF